MSEAGLVGVPPSAVTVNGAAAPVPSADSLIVSHGGYDNSSLVLSYQLPPHKAGHYEIWTAFTLGGVADQTFRLSAGSSNTAMSERASWTQSNGVSWKLDWRRADAPVTIYPQDRALTVEESGSASGHKAIVGIFLVRTAKLPDGMDEKGGELRATMASWRPSTVTRRIYLLESGAAEDAAPLLNAIERHAGALKPGTSVNIFDGNESRTMASRSGIVSLPALIVMDDAYGIRAVCHCADPPKRLDLALTTNAPIDFAEPTVNTPGSNTGDIRVASGELGEWLVAGDWAGVGGLSLWGLGAERDSRPSLDDPCDVLQFDTLLRSKWRAQLAGSTGIVVIDRATDDFAWARGMAYACVYLKSAQASRLMLHFSQSGINTAGWLNTQPLDFVPDSSTAAVKLHRSAGASNAVVSTTDQGNSVLVQPAHPQGPIEAQLNLKAGWNRLLVKLVMQNTTGQAFFFGARLTDALGSPIPGLKASQSDPESSSNLHAEAVRVQPIVTTDAPFNLAYAGDPLHLRVDVKRLPTAPEPEPIVPLPSFEARLNVTIRDYDNEVVASRSSAFTFPGAVNFDLGATPPTGYYSVHLTLTTPSGSLVAAYPPDGFSVIAGTASQLLRANKKKMAATYYFMNDGRYDSLYFPYMKRIGIFRNIGGNPGPSGNLYRDAKKEGIRLSGELWDIDSPETMNATVVNAAPFVDSFKSYNEVDIVPSVRGTAAHWTQITREHYQAVKAVSPNAIVLSASLVRPGADSWFKDCLALGMDKYVDVWDVHCYPRNPPVLEGPMGNSPDETELGVLKAYASLGRSNDKPFWIGETGARASHGFDARRWQADMIAKMTACANSRADFQKIGFLVPYYYSRQQSWLNDIEAGHMPAEASYYTASALIDGLPYRRFALGSGVQAARFGPTTMLWSDGEAKQVALKLDTSKKWVVVDVVGRVAPLAVPPSGKVSLMSTTSPIYVLTKPDYGQLTRF